MTIRVTTIFEAPLGGWTESWYYPDALPADGVYPAKFSNLDDLRAKMLGKPNIIIGSRMSNYPATRQVFPWIYDVPPKLMPGVGNMEVPQLAWLAQLKSIDGGMHRQVWLRGCPDDSVAFSLANNKQVPDGNFVEAFNAWALALRNANGSVRTIRSWANSPNKGTVSAVAANGGNAAVDLSITVAVNPPDTTLPLVLSGFRKPLNTLNGTYAPTVGWALDAGVIRVYNKIVSAFAVASYQKGGKWRNASYQFSQFITAQLIFARVRKTGRQLFVPAGRQSRR